MKRLISSLLFCFLGSYASAQAPAPTYPAPALGLKKCVINHGVGSPDLKWVNGALVITAKGNYNYMNNYTFDKIEVDVKWVRAQGNPLLLQGPTASITPEASIVAPPNYEIPLLPLLPPPGYTDCQVTVRISVKAKVAGVMDETDVNGKSVLIPVKIDREDPG